MGGFGMQEGKRLEYDVFGSIKKSSQYFADEDILRKKYGKNTPLVEVMDLVKKHQPNKWNPVNPSKPFLKDLKLEIGDLLNLPEKDLDKIKTFTAIDSLLDTHFGVDAFLTLEKDEKEFFVTYDLTANHNKESTRRYNTILITDFTEPPDPIELKYKQEYNEKETAYLLKVEEIAKSSVDQLRSSGF